MGNKCCGGGRAPQADGGEYPVVDLNEIKDQYEKWEKSFPFYRMHVQTMSEKIGDIGKGAAPFEPNDLGYQMTGYKLWNGLFKQNTKLWKLITKLPNCDEKSISYTSMMCLSLLWCGGDDSEKAQALISIVNPPGENQDSVSANDKQWPLVLDTIFEIATAFTFSQLKLKDQESPDTYKKLYHCMRSHESDDKKYTGLIDNLFGTEGKYTADEFVMYFKQTGSNWLFSPKKIRERARSLLKDD